MVRDHQRSNNARTLSRNYLFSNFLRWVRTVYYRSIVLSRGERKSKASHTMEDITVQELKEKMDAQEAFVLIDVREPYEHEAFNVGGQLIPMGKFPAVLDELEAHRRQEIVVYCRSGRRSGIIKEMMAQAGFDKVRNLEGGMLA